MRRWVCRLQLLLALSSAVILGSGSRGTHVHILLSQIRDSPNLEAQVSVKYIPQEQDYPVIPPDTGFPFCRLLGLAGLRWRYLTPPPPVPNFRVQSYFTTGGLPIINSSWREAPWDSRPELYFPSDKIKVKVILRPTVIRPASLIVKHWSWAYDQIFISVRQLQVCVCGALSDERTGLPFTVAAGPRQRCHSWVRVPRDSLRPSLYIHWTDHREDTCWAHIFCRILNRYLVADNFFWLHYSGPFCLPCHNIIHLLVWHCRPMLPKVSEIYL
jgi:hypothetical protein